jgi:hypothetical protein
VSDASNSDLTCDLFGAEIQAGSENDFVYSDALTTAKRLIVTPRALQRYYLDVCDGRGKADPIRHILAFDLLARFKLNFPFNTAYLDQRYSKVMQYSSAVNSAFELLPIQYSDRFADIDPLSGFKHLFSGFEELTVADTDKINHVLQYDTPQNDPLYKKNVGIFRIALGILLENAADLDDILSSLKLKVYQLEQPEKRTADLINGLGDYFGSSDYGRLKLHQLCVLAECKAFMKRFYRKSWCIEVEDVSEAWFVINYCVRSRLSLNKNVIKMLRYVQAQNRQKKFPSQRKVIKGTELPHNTVSRAMRCDPESLMGVGTLILEGFVAYDAELRGYRITEFGELVLDGNSFIKVNGKIYRPKNPLELA